MKLENRKYSKTCNPSEMSVRDEKLQMQEYVLNPLTNRCCLASGVVAQKLAKLGKLSPEDMAKVTIRPPGRRKKGETPPVIRKAPIRADREENSDHEVESEPGEEVTSAVRKGKVRKVGGSAKKVKRPIREVEEVTEEMEGLSLGDLFDDLFSSESESETD